MSAAWWSRLRLVYGLLGARLVFSRLGRRVGQRITRLGTDYGGWPCHVELLPSAAVAFCVGAGEDVSFDVLLNSRYGARVWCIDPTPRAIEHVRTLLEGRAVQAYELRGFDAARFRLLSYALWSSDGSLRLYEPSDRSHVSHSAVNLQKTVGYIVVEARRLESLLAEAGVTHLDLLKLDVEGAEYAVIDDLCRGRIRPTQLLVEFEEVNRPASLTAPSRIAAAVRRLQRAGYLLTHHDRSNFLFLHGATG